MARSSNLSSRIERILNVRRFRSAFQSSRGHSYLAALLVPASLIAAVALIRVAPAVEAAQVATSARTALTAPVQPEDQVTSVNFGQAAPPAPAAPVLAPPSPEAAPSAPSPVAPPAVEGVVAPEPPDTDVEAPEVPEPARNEIHTRGNGSVYSYSDDDDGSFAIVRGDSNLTISGHNSRKLQKAREKYGNNFIWFERDDKSYVITDPAVLAQSQSLFKDDPRLAERQKALEMRQAELDKQMALLSPEMEKASLPGPEFAAEMAKLNAELSQLQGDKLKKLIDASTAKALQDSKLNQQELQQRIQEQMGEIQERMGEIQGHLGEIQGKIGERQGLIGEKQGELGERMGKLGEEMGKIGEEQGRRAEEDSRKLRSIIDQAYKNGKAKPVE